MADKTAWPLRGDMVLVRGGGDLATGVVQKFYRAGMRVVVLESGTPMAIRRTVSLCTAVWDGEARIEDMVARRVASPQDCHAQWEAGRIPLLVDPEASAAEALAPSGVVDAILAKRNLGTHRGMAPAVIGLGPGFTAQEDVHAVVETMRGHWLGRVIWQGTAIPNTGIPGEIGGEAAQRVLRAPCEGVVAHHRAIGDHVRAGDAVFSVAGQVVAAPFEGILRGLLQEGLRVSRGMKTADIDPRLGIDCHTISDKARCVGGGALEAYLALCYRQGVPHVQGDFI